MANEKLRELLWEPLRAERDLFDEDDELEKLAWKQSISSSSGDSERSSCGDPALRPLPWRSYNHSL
jgi:hypothetical protein